MVSSGMGELSVVGPDLRRRFANPDLGREELVELVNGYVAASGAAITRAGLAEQCVRVSKLALNALTRILARELAARRSR
jgi:hypothetical protein